MENAIFECSAMKHPLVLMALPRLKVAGATNLTCAIRIFKSRSIQGIILLSRLSILLNRSLHLLLARSEGNNDIMQTHIIRTTDLKGSN
jgi:hypothetical protein